MLWVEIEAVEEKASVPIGIKHKVVKHYCAIDIETALDGVCALRMTTLLILAGGKDQKENDWIEEE